jgi:hypothetical protein
VFPLVLGRVSARCFDRRGHGRVKHSLGCAWAFRYGELDGATLAAAAAAATRQHAPVTYWAADSDTIAETKLHHHDLAIIRDTWSRMPPARGPARDSDALRPVSRVQASEY